MKKNVFSNCIICLCNGCNWKKAKKETYYNLHFNLFKF